MAGEQRLCVTVFRLVEALDAGDVLTRALRDFEPGTSAGDALAELASFGTDALLDAVRLLETHPEAGEPQLGEASSAHKLSREDGRLDLAAPATRALARWAGAVSYTHLDVYKRQASKSPIAFEPPPTQATSASGRRPSASRSWARASRPTIDWKSRTIDGNGWGPTTEPIAKRYSSGFAA